MSTLSFFNLFYISNSTQLVSLHILILFFLTLHAMSFCFKLTFCFPRSLLLIPLFFVCVFKAKTYPKLYYVTLAAAAGERNHTGRETCVFREESHTCQSQALGGLTSAMFYFLITFDSFYAKPLSEGSWEGEKVGKRV